MKLCECKEILRKYEVQPISFNLRFCIIESFFLIMNYDFLLMSQKKY